MELAHLHIEAEKGALSAECVDRGIISFLSLTEWVEQLPYKRNSNRSYQSVFEEECGTCSTKNALIKAVSIENDWNFVQLFVGIYKMSEATNPSIGKILKVKQLDYLPEAHTYLKINTTIQDFTGLKKGKEAFSKNLLKEIEITPDQIEDFKPKWHYEFIVNWSQSTPYSPQEIWKIREACILILAQEN